MAGASRFGRPWGPCKTPPSLHAARHGQCEKPLLPAASAQPDGDRSTHSSQGLCFPYGKSIAYWVGVAARRPNNDGTALPPRYTRCRPSQLASRPLREASECLLISGDPRPQLRRLAELFGAHLGVHRVSILLMEGAELRLAAGVGLPSDLQRGRRHRSRSR